MFLLCFLFSQTAQGQSFTPGEIWPDNHQVHINAHGYNILSAFYFALGAGGRGFESRYPDRK